MSETPAHEAELLLPAANHGAYLSELAHGVECIVGADELEVLHGRHRYTPVEVEAVVSFGVGRLPRLKKKHVTVPALLHARQLPRRVRGRGQRGFVRSP